MEKNLAWGLAVPEHAKTAWGARAIFRPPSNISIVWDRQDAIGEGADRQALHGWINIALDFLRTALLRRQPRVNPEDDTVLLVQGYDRCLLASPRGSYGYMYLSAFYLREPEALSFAHRGTRMRLRTDKLLALPANGGIIEFHFEESLSGPIMSNPIARAEREGVDTWRLLDLSTGAYVSDQNGQLVHTYDALRSLAADVADAKARY